MLPPRLTIDDATCGASAEGHGAERPSVPKTGPALSTVDSIPRFPGTASAVPLPALRTSFAIADIRVVRRWVHAKGLAIMEARIRGAGVPGNVSVRFTAGSRPERCD